MHQTLHFKKTQQKQKLTLKHKSIAGYLMPQHKCELVPDPEDVKKQRTWLLCVDPSVYDSRSEPDV